MQWGSRAFSAADRHPSRPGSARRLWIQRSLAGCSALISLSWLGSGRPNIGQNLELTSLTAAMLGGIGIFGGKGGVVGVLVAVLLLVTLQTGLLQLNLNTIWQVGIIGALLILVLLIDNVSLFRRTA